MGSKWVSKIILITYGGGRWRRNRRPTPPFRTFMKFETANGIDRKNICMEFDGEIWPKLQALVE
jgi:hypothetical protein